MRAMTDLGMTGLRERVIRLAGGGPLIDAAEFYAERTAPNMRGTTGRWAPGVHPAPQPKLTARGEPSMWDYGSIARWALTTALGHKNPLEAER